MEDFHARRHQVISRMLPTASPRTPTVANQPPELPPRRLSQTSLLPKVSLSIRLRALVCFY